jgi:probable O-glycosylation ligase (exosortase A-associated)
MSRCRSDSERRREALSVDMRIAVVYVLLTIGVIYALQGPLQALVLYLWLAYFRPDRWIYWQNPFTTMNLSYFAGIYLLLRTVLGGTSFRLDLRTALLGALLVQSGISAVTSDYATRCTFFFQSFAKSLIISYLIAVLVTDSSRLRIIVLAIALSVSLDAAKQGWVELVLNSGAENENRMTILGDNNGIAIGMSMLVPLLLALARTSRASLERWFYWFLAVGVFYRGISTYSRGGFLSAAALGLVFVLRSPRRVPALVGIALATALVVSVMPERFWSRMDTIRVNDPAEMENTAEGRFHFWEVAVIMVEDHPFFGVGHGAGFRLAYDRYDFSNGRSGRGRDVHSAWFGILADLGLPGFLLFIGSLAGALVACRRARRLARRGEVSKDVGEFAVALETALIVFGVGGTFVSFQYTEMLWHLIGLSIAVNFLTAGQLAQRKTATITADSLPVETGPGVPSPARL